MSRLRSLGLALPRSLPLRLGLGVAVCYAAVFGLFSLTYRSFLYPAPKSGLEPQVGGATLWRLPAERGDVIALFAPPSGAKPVIVGFHGNGEELVDLAPLARALIDRGFGVLFVEYPGYGLAAGQQTTEHAIYDAAERALRELDEQGYGAGDVVLLGQSLGTGVAVEMAARARGARLVLISPYTSMADVVRRYVPFLPVGFVVRDRYETLAKASNVEVPTLVVHGGKDKLIPADMGRQVAQRIAGARLEILEDAAHNDVWRGEALLGLVVEHAGALACERGPGRKGAGATAPLN